MPLPNRNKGETHDRFIDRCMADPTMTREFPDAAQRRAVCERQASAGAGQALELVCDLGGLTIEAAAAGAGDGGEAKLPTFKLVAYTGAPMQVGWPHPVVVDLAGLAIPSQKRPVRSHHDASAGVGHTTAIAVEDHRLTAEGVISRDTEAAREIVASAKRGFPWQASIGTSVQEFESVKDGQTVEVNGRKFKGPLNVVRKATLGEISFVDLGADSKTSAKVAAEAAGEMTTMQTYADWLKSKEFGDESSLTEGQNTFLRAQYDADTKVEAAGLPPTPPPGESPPHRGAVGASGDDPDAGAVIEAARRERGRRAKIGSLVSEAINRPGADLDRLEQIAAEAVNNRWTIQETELAILRAARPRAAQPHGQGAPPAAEMLEAAALMAVGHKADGLVRSHGEQLVEAARRRFGHSMGLQELLLTCAQANGYTGRPRVSVGNWRELVGYATRQGRDVQAAAGYSTVDLTGILGNVANKALAAIAGEPQWLTNRLCGIASHANFQTHTVYSLAMNGELEQVGPTGELKHLSFSEESWTRQVQTRGAILRLSRTDVINDDLGVFARNAAGLARKAYTTREKAFFTLLCASAAGASHFTAARGNYLTGAGTAFSAAAMATAIVAFRGLKGPDGDPVMVEPAIVLLPPTLEDEGRRLLAAGSNVIMYGAGTSKVIGSTANIYAGRFGGAPLVSPWLENAALTGHSTAYWYLFADPVVYPAYEIAYLNGNQVPTVEYFGLDADVDTLGMAWRVFWDFGVSVAEWRAGVKSAGA